MGIDDLLNKMEAAETAFLNAEFLAPVLPGGRVRVRIAGVVCTLRVTEKSEPGWAILRPVTMDTARIVARPGLGQIRAYLSLFPAVRLLLVSRAGADWIALPAHRSDTRFQTGGTVRVHLVTAGEVFQQVVARFDGSRFWFQEADRRRNPAVGAYLREALRSETLPEELRKPTLTAEERSAYGLLRKALQEARRDQTEVRLSDALAHAGASLTSYIDREDAYTVSFQVDGEMHRSTIRKNDLTVLSAGICLEGQDRHFDLHSLVSVIREGRRRGEIVRDDYDDEF